MMAAVLTCKTSELTGLDLWPPNSMAFRKSAATMLLCYVTSLHKSDLKLRFLRLLCANITVNMTKVVIKILQAIAVTETT